MHDAPASIAVAIRACDVLFIAIVLHSDLELSVYFDVLAAAYLSQYASESIRQEYKTGPSWHHSSAVLLLHYIY